MKLKTLKVLSLFLTLAFVLTLSNTAYAANNNKKDNGEDWDVPNWITKFCNRYDNNGDEFSLCFKKKPQVYIYATKYSVKGGKSTVLYWESKRAETCSASGGWSGAKDVNSAEKVTPPVTTTYTITCVNDVGSYTDSVEIWVNNPVGTTTPPAATTTPTVTLNGSPLSIVNGATSTLSWNSSNATSCTASNGWAGSKALTGNQVISPSATTTYVLSCSGAGGTASSTVIIGVTAVATSTPPATTTPPTVTFSGSPLSIFNGGTTTLTWSSTDTTSCTASNGWAGSKSTSGNQIVSPSATTTYDLSCSGAGGTATGTVTIGVTEAATSTPATTTLDHLLLSEVYYDVGAGKGSEPGNEWVELYNGTGAPVDVSGWFIADSTGFDPIPASTIIPNGGFLVLTGSSTTSGLWGSVPMVVLGNSTIGGGLGNTGDALHLRNAASTTVDSMSYGSDTSVFNPSAPDVTSGHSLRRSSLSADNNTAADWSDQVTPNPGS